MKILGLCCRFASYSAPCEIFGLHKMIRNAKTSASKDYVLRIISFSDLLCEVFSIHTASKGTFCHFKNFRCICFQSHGTCSLKSIILIEDFFALI